MGRDDPDGIGGGGGGPELGSGGGGGGRGSDPLVFCLLNKRREESYQIIKTKTTYFYTRVNLELIRNEKIDPHNVIARELIRIRLIHIHTM